MKYKIKIPLLAIFICLLSCSNPENKFIPLKPNVIIILADDQGYGDLGSYGSQTIKTPNIDELANEGIRFTDFYAHPICSPSRAALLTGCYAPRTGFADVQLWGSPFGLNPEEVTIAEVLKEEDYATACIGKWHLGERDAFAPNRQGFDYFYGIRLVNGTQKFENFAVPFYRNDSLLTMRPDHSVMTEDFTRESISFIDKSKERPFFLYLAFTMPHIPVYPGEKFRGKSGVSLYADAVEEIDWSVGQIVEKLKEEGLDENTLIIYVSDNGPWAGHGDQSGSAGPLKGSKISTWEGGVRVPCIMKWKNTIPASKVYRKITGIIDIAPTIAAIAGTGMPDDRVIDGKNLLPYIIQKENVEVPHKAYYHYAGTWLQSVRAGKWKLHFARPEKRPGIYGECAPWFTQKAEILPEDLLFDLETDVGESRNLAEEYPDVVQRLKDLANWAREDIGDYGSKGNNSRRIGSTYPGLTDISQYPQTPYAKTIGDSMVVEMRAFQRNRLVYLAQQELDSLNEQEKEELSFYKETLINKIISTN
ncbi:MAG: arylsulfatase A [Cyclobacteriaceae bacterium]|jgi:arylsulfatase A-like enzyme